MTIDEITYKINGCTMKVHNTLGNGFQKIIYQRCLAIELEKAVCVLQGFITNFS